MQAPAAYNPVADPDFFQTRSSNIGTPQILSYIALFLLICGDFFSAIIFGLDATDHGDVISLWYTSIFWPIYNALFLVLFISSAWVYIGRLPKGESSEFARFFYPRYQWDVHGGITFSVILFLIGFVSVVSIVPQLGLGFEPDFTSVHDPSTDKYSTLHLLMTCISFIGFLEKFNYGFTYIGAPIYQVANTRTILDSIQPSNKVVLYKPDYSQIPQQQRTHLQ